MLQCVKSTLGSVVAFDVASNVIDTELKGKNLFVVENVLNDNNSSIGLLMSVFIDFHVLLSFFQFGYTYLNPELLVAFRTLEN